MRVLCGNYREKMTQEDQNFKLSMYIRSKSTFSHQNIIKKKIINFYFSSATNMKISSKSKPQKKAVVLRKLPKSNQKSKVLSDQPPTTSTQTLSSMMKSMKVETENKKETFKFNFNVEEDQEGKKTDIKSETQVKSEPEEKFKFVKSDNSFRFNF